MKAKKHYEGLCRDLFAYPGGKEITLGNGVPICIPQKASTAIEEIQWLYEDFLEEFNKIRAYRRILEPDKVKKLLQEVNDKWNKVYDLFKEKYGFSPIRRNAFRDRYNWPHCTESCDHGIPAIHSEDIILLYSNEKESNPHV